MNWIDALILLVFVFYVYEDYHRGFLRLVADLMGLVLAFVVAVIYYADLAVFIVKNSHLALDSVRPLSFLFIWAIVQVIFFIITKLISRQTPITIKESVWNKYLAIIPAMIKGVLFITIIMILVVAMPIDQQKKKFFTESGIGQLTLSYAVKGEAQLEQIFGGAANYAIATQGAYQAKDEATMLKFSTTNMTIDLVAEKYILDKVNEERAKVGGSALTVDPLIRNVARAHARDMLIRGYFAHDSLDGETLFMRYSNANVSFISAAENIALAPSQELVHLGLMNSEKHKRNMLAPEYTRVGIGVLNAGQYGLMVVEDFAN